MKRNFLKRKYIILLVFIFIMLISIMNRNYFIYLLNPYDFLDKGIEIGEVKLGIDIDQFLAIDSLNTKNERMPDGYESYVDLDNNCCYYFDMNPNSEILIAIETDNKEHEVFGVHVNDDIKKAESILKKAGFKFGKDKSLCVIGGASIDFDLKYPDRISRITISYYK